MNPTTLPIDTGATAWMLTSSALVLLMVPGLAMFYGGLVRRKNVIGTMMHSFAAMAIIGVVWTVCGYALTFGQSVGGWFGWDASKLMLSDIDGRWLPISSDSARIPEFAFVAFQGKFAIITPALIAGAFAERVRFGAYCLFIALWSVLVYCPLAHIVWGGGFLTGEAIDLAGGTVIHVSAGIAGLVGALYLGARQDYGRRPMTPNNLVMTMIGAGLLWVGWFGFNAGSQVSSGIDAARALALTQVAAAGGACIWMLLEWSWARQVTSVGLVSGVLCGLVAITPAAGDVTVVGALSLGAMASFFCFGAIRVKERLGYDDTLDVFGIHGVAGIVGALGLVMFLRDVPEHGLVTQTWYQIKGVGIAIAFSGVVTLVLLRVIDRLVGLRMDHRDESKGMDQVLHGELGYGLLHASRVDMRI